MRAEVERVRTGVVMDRGAARTAAAVRMRESSVVRIVWSVWLVMGLWVDYVVGSEFVSGSSRSSPVQRVDMEML